MSFVPRSMMPAALRSRMEFTSRDGFGFRMGTWSEFSRLMRSDLVRLTVRDPGGGSRPNPLARIDISAADGFVPALVHGWATALDVLTFYQERLAHEGFLDTAIDPMSVAFLAEALGYQPRPALSATVHLSFTILEGDPTLTALPLPKGIAVQALPPASGLPAVFETEREVIGRADFNRLRCHVDDSLEFPGLAAGLGSVTVAGVSGGLVPGTPLLMLGAPGTGAEVPLVAEIQRTEANPALLRTTINLNPPRSATKSLEAKLKALEEKHQESGPKSRRLFAFDREVRLFGADAVPWKSLADSVKAANAPRLGDLLVETAGAWTWCNGGLPPSAIRHLAVGDGGTLFAATATTALRLDPGANWVPLAVPPGLSITALTYADGRLYLGSDRGDVAVSTDGGDSWGTVGGSLVPGKVPPAGLARLPSVPVRAILVIPSDEVTKEEVKAADAEKKAKKKPGPIDRLKARIAALKSTLAGLVAPLGVLAKPLKSLLSKVPWQKIADSLKAKADAVAHRLSPYIQRAMGMGMVALPAKLLAAPFMPMPGTAAAASSAGSGLEKNEEPVILAATDNGVWRTTPNGANWFPSSDGLPGWSKENGGATVIVRDLARNLPDRRIFAATEAGLFYSRDKGRHWHRTDLSAKAVRYVEAWEGVIFAAEDTRVHATDDKGLWHAAAELPEAARSSTFSGLAVDGKGLLLGTADGPYESTDRGATWAPLQVGEPKPGTPTDLALMPGSGDGAAADGVTGDVSAAAAGTGPYRHERVAAITAMNGRRAIAMAFRGYREEAWPAAQKGPEFFLDQVVPALTPGGWMVLQDAVNPPTAFKIKEVGREVRADYLLTNMVNKVTVEGEATDGFDPRTTRAFVLSRKLEPVLEGKRRLSPVRGRDLKLSGAWDGLEDRDICLTGQRIGGHLTGAAGGIRRRDGTNWPLIGSASESIFCMIPIRGIRPEDRSYMMAGTDAGPMLITIGSPASSDSAPDVVTPANRWPLRIVALVEIADHILLATEDGFRRFPTADLERLADLDLRAADTVSGLKISDTPAGKREVQWLHALDDKTVLAATSAGLWRLSLDPAAATLEPEPGIPDDTIVNQIAGDGDLILAATGKGLYRRDKTGWVLADPAFAGVRVSCVTVTQTRCYAGIWDGVLVCDRPAMAWGPLWQEKRTGPPSRIAAIGEDILTLEPNRGLSVNGVLQTTGSSTGICCLVVAGDNVWIGSRLAPTVWSDESESFQVIWRHPGNKSPVKGNFAEDLDRKIVSQELRSALVLTDVTLADDVQVEVVEQKKLWRLRESEAPRWLIRQRSEGVYQIFIDHCFEVLDGPHWPASDEASTTPVKRNQDDPARWTVRLPSGFTGQVVASEQEMLWERAAPHYETVSEIRHIGAANIYESRAYTEVTLDRPMDSLLDPHATVINANVAEATHGETATMYDVLGSGDHKVPDKSFRLKRLPLTVLRDQDGGWYPDLQVRIRPGLAGDAMSLGSELVPNSAQDRSILWKRTDNLLESGPDDRHYEVHIDSDGLPEVRFGDGVNGSVLPTGTENVLALYRTGTGPSGNTPPDKIINLMRRPAGVFSVTNPLPATGGIDREPPDEIRMRAPLSVRTLDRLISLSDYRDYVRAWPGIAKSHATMLRAGQGHPVVHITIARDGGRVEPENSGDTDNLRNQLRQHQTGRHMILIGEFEPVRFRLGAEVTHDPDRQPESVRKAVVDDLTARYGFERRGFGEAVTAASLTADIQRMAGVRAVRIVRLYRVARLPELAPDITPAPARWDAGTATARPAQIVLLADTDDAVEITMVAP